MADEEILDPFEQARREAEGIEPDSDEDRAAAAAEHEAEQAAAEATRQQVLDDLLAAAKALKPGASHEQLFRRGCFAGLGDGLLDLLIKAIAAATGVTLSALRKDLKRIAEEVKAARRQQAREEAERVRATAEAANLADPELAKVQAAFPLDGKTVFYKRYGGKIWAGHQVLVNGSSVFEALHSPWRIDGRLHLSGKTKGKGLRVTIRDEDGQEIPVTLQRSELASTGDRNGLLGRLMHVGMLIDEKAKPILLNKLQKSDSSNIIAVIDRPGFHDIAGNPCYITVYGKVLGASNVKAELNPVALIAERDAVKGTLDGWLATARWATAIKGAPHWRLAYLLPFAAPLIDLLDIDNAILNVQGPTSLGKTIVLLIGASGWGMPSVRKTREGARGMVFSARITGNSIEGIAEMTSGMGTFIDDLAKVSGKEVYDITFVYADGAGKIRSDRKGKARVDETASWRGLLATASERSLYEMVVSDPRANWTPGAAVRMLNIGIGGLVDKDLAGEAQRLGRDLSRNYGHAGPAFCEKLLRMFGSVEGRARLLEVIDRNSATFERRHVDDAEERVASNVERRTHAVFGLLKTAGKLAAAFDLLPETLNVDATVDWAYDAFIRASAGQLAPEDEAIDEIRTTLLSVWFSHTAPCLVDSGGGNFGSGLANNKTPLDIWAWWTNEAVFIPAHFLGKFTRLSDKASIAERLFERNMLVTRLLKKKRDRNGQIYQKHFCEYIPGQGHTKAAYPLRRDQFGPAFHDPRKLEGHIAILGEQLKQFKDPKLHALLKERYKKMGKTTAEADAAIAAVVNQAEQALADAKARRVGDEVENDPE